MILELVLVVKGPVRLPFELLLEARGHAVRKNFD
jgi:hypothetical protein